MIAGRSPAAAIESAAPAVRPGAQALAFDAMRRLLSARSLRDRLVAKPPPERVDALLLTAIALLSARDGRYSDATLVDQAVAATRRLAPGAAGFVNAVLRRLLREFDQLHASVDAEIGGLGEHPEWWVARLRADWPDDWPARLKAANRQAPMWLRANSRIGPVEDRIAELRAAGIEVADQRGSAILLDRATPVERLPGFAQGHWSVQDYSAQIAVDLLAACSRPRDRVLDACAAPGGKTAQWLERVDVDLLALDRDPQRLRMVAANLERLRLRAELKAADARDVESWWDGRPFAAILLDAPCSASGIVRRHPDIRWLRRPEDVEALVREQAQLLDALWPLLAPGGVLAYVTCSIFRAEGKAQVDAFLQRPIARGAVLVPASPGEVGLVPDNSVPAPAADPGDGFFIALLRKD